MARGLAVGEDLLIRPSSVPKIGKGLFTNIELAPNTYLGEYVGEVVAVDTFLRRRESSYDASCIQ